MAALQRRSFLIGAACALIAGACGSRRQSQDAATGAAGPSQAELSEIAFVALTFPDGFSAPATLVHGAPQRLPVVLHSRFDTMRQTAPERLRIAVTAAVQPDADAPPDATDAPPEVLFDAEVTAHRDGIITPYYPVLAAFGAPGEYSLALPDHPEVPAVAFLVADAADVAIPAPGEALPAPHTPTFDDARGVTPICTRAIPCELHDLDLADVVGNGRPTALLVATPGFCQTDICGPVVDLLMEQAPARPGVDFVHAEVYVDPSEFSSGRFPETTVVVKALGLPYEPALFVADGEGVIRARLDTTWDRAELTAALSSVA